MIPASETFPLPDTQKNVQSPQVLAVFVVQFVRVGSGFMQFESHFTIGAASLYSHFCHDIAVYYLGPNHELTPQARKKANMLTAVASVLLKAPMMKDSQGLIFVVTFP